MGVRVSVGENGVWGKRRGKQGKTVSTPYFLFLPPAARMDALGIKVRAGLPPTDSSGQAVPDSDDHHPPYLADINCAFPTSFVRRDSIGKVASRHSAVLTVGSCFRYESPSSF
jgi:hypothetical protein